jgi:hypothetical protein
MDFDRSLNSIDLEVMRSQLLRALYWKNRELETARENDVGTIQSEIDEIKDELAALDDYCWILKKAFDEYE